MKQINSRYLTGTKPNELNKRMMKPKPERNKTLNLFWFKTRTKPKCIVVFKLEQNQMIKTFRSPTLYKTVQKLYFSDQKTQIYTPNFVIICAISLFNGSKVQSSTYYTCNFDLAQITSRLNWPIRLRIFFIKLIKANSGCIDQVQKVLAKPGS